jgi:cell pole-organizing protein PopZ
MEEILASIRRIISEDETNSTRARPAAASQRDEEAPEAVEGEADDRIINDIARALGGAQAASEEAPIEEDDILDLTAELGGLEVVEETTLIELVPEEAQEEVVAEFQAEPEIPDIEAAAPEAEAEAPQTVAPEAQAPEPMAPPTPMSASEEAATALERAIAALRAGQLPTSISEFSLQPAPQPEPVAMADEPEPIFEPAPEPQAEPEPELVLTEFEAESLAAEEPVMVEAESEAEVPAWESETAPWAATPEPPIEPERPAAHTNGGAHADSAHKSLEDSIKDMIRPMLRQWLDENMARVLTAALQDEIRNDPTRFQRD